MHISRIQVKNFRNFRELDVRTQPGIVIVGENQVGKSNLVHALRLVLDPTVGDLGRRLRLEDFWDGLARPLTQDGVIEISVEISDFRDIEEEALLADYLIQGEPPIAKLTYRFQPKPGVDAPKQSGDYEWQIFGGDRPHEVFDHYQRSRFPMEVVQAARNATTELQQWHRNPLKPMLEDAAGKVDAEELRRLVEDIQTSTNRLLEVAAVQEVSGKIRSKVLEAVGVHHSSDYSLGLGPVEAQKLLRALRIFFDDGQRGMLEASDGASNLVYLILKTMQVEMETVLGNRDHTILAIEEPEAFLHPHLQRLVYHKFLRDRFQADERGLAKTSAIITTHSPHVASVAPLRNILYLRKDPHSGSTVGKSLAHANLDPADEIDLERYLDATRSELVFSRATMFVEGASEQILIPKLARDMNRDLDRNGVSVININGTHFSPYVAVVDARGLHKPFAVITDGDAGAPVTGVARARTLLLEMGKVEAEGAGDAELLPVAANAGIFVGTKTFEVDLWRAGAQVHLRQALLSLHTTGPMRNEVEAWQPDGDGITDQQLMRHVDHVGKTVLAQRLAAANQPMPCPAYVRRAIESLTLAGENPGDEA